MDARTAVERLAGMQGLSPQEQVDAVVALIVHRDELLARAAEMIDPDSNVPANYPTYEQRLDWLAKWREVVAR